ncbi:Dyp-type peroxidase [Embleya sp. NBC_00888]|uniref:Dyp-type peroxidase n=1 Tax=Embleya sp. NBC_00888 TaxID=2975960 RepID=UPI003863E5B1|nr:Dyp-type peroxidase [Embleya sp. NBC_00888]
MGRRALLATGAALAAAVGAAAEPVPDNVRAQRRGTASGAPPATTAIDFHGPRQAGVTGPQLPATQMLSLDLPPTSATADRETLRNVLAALTRTLSTAAAGTLPDPRLRTGETTRLACVVGVGTALASRLGLNVPAELADLPPFPGDRLDAARGNGDVLLQLCAADRWTPTVVAELAAAAAQSAGAVSRWTQSGFLPHTAPGITPRNLFGFKDGTANPDDTAAVRWVWGPPGAHRNGTILVYRRIHMDVAGFAAVPEDRQNRIIGRRAGDGVPLTGTAEHDDPDIYAKHPDGSYVIPVTSHVRLSSPRLDGGARMLRRSYNYDDGPNDRGLLFCAFMRDPALFTRVQNRMAARDALIPFIEHRASAVAYILPGINPGGTLGEQLWT